jgi:hypothetical protein
LNRVIDQDTLNVEVPPNVKAFEIPYDSVAGKAASEAQMVRRAEFLAARVAAVERSKGLVMKLLDQYKLVENKGLRFSDLMTKRHLLNPNVFYF